MVNTRGANVWGKARVRARVAASLAALSWVCAGPPAAADEPYAPGLRRGTGSPLQWQPGWRRFGWINGAAIGLGAGAAVMALVVGPNRDTPSQWRWSVDEDIRSVLRPRSRGTRVAVRRASDLLLTANVSAAYLGDVFLNAAWYRDSPDVALQLALIDAQVLALATGVQLWTANLASRERPYGRVCDTHELSAASSDCTGDYRYRSFYSGHTSTSFALAAATCTHHAYLPLYQGGAAWAPCAVTLTFAGATGFARIVADQHYTTDVVTGAALGSAIGWLVPWLHYSAGGSSRSGSGTSRDGLGTETSPGNVHWALVPTPGGLAVSGVF